MAASRLESLQQANKPSWTGRMMVKTQARRYSSELRGWSLRHRPPEPPTGQPKGAAGQRPVRGEVLEPRREASARRATMARSEALEVNRPHWCFQDSCQQLKGRGAPTGPCHSEMHVGDPTSKFLCPRLSPSITKVEVLMIRHRVAGKRRPRNFTQSTSAMLSRTPSRVP